MGDTLIEPVTLVVVPIPLSMKTLWMPLPLQESVAELPFWIEVGATVSTQEGCVVVTVTSAAQVAVCPDALVTVPVKVVLVVMASDVTEPPATGVTGPTPWSIEKVFPFVVVQVSVLVPPLFTLVGFAVSVQTGQGGR